MRPEFLMFSVFQDDIRVEPIVRLLNREQLDNEYHLFRDDDNRYKVILTTNDYLVVTETDWISKDDLIMLLSKELVAVLTIYSV